MLFVVLTIGASKIRIGAASKKNKKILIQISSVVSLDELVLLFKMNTEFIVFSLYCQFL